MIVCYKCGLGLPNRSLYKLHMGYHPPEDEPASQTPPHTHQYVIPVEWRAGYRKGSVPEARAMFKEDTPYNGFAVTRLRCSCGKETTR